LPETSARAPLWRAVQRWRGVAIIGTMAAVTLWLAYSGQLVLYIHPRYIVFTVIMAGIAVVLSLLAVAGRRDHDDEHGAPRPDANGCSLSPLRASPAPSRSAWSCCPPPR
jgi:hypothetical protein